MSAVHPRSKNSGYACKEGRDKTELIAVQQSHISVIKQQVALAECKIKVAGRPMSSSSFFDTWSYISQTAKQRPVKSIPEVWSYISYSWTGKITQTFR